MIYKKIKTSQGNIFTAPMASGGGLTDLILRCLVFVNKRIKVVSENLERILYLFFTSIPENSNYINA